MSVDINNPSPEMLRLLKAMHDSGIHTPSAMLEATRTAQLGILEHGEKHFYIKETGLPLVWTPVQRILLPIIAGSHSYPRLLPFYNTIYWSTPKKMAKTATSGAYARWRAESKTLNDEILFFANDETQSRGRAYAAIEESLNLNPLWDKVKRILYDEHGNPVWRVIEDYLEHIPTATKVRAVNVDYRGEAGSNPSLTVWTEVWGYDTDKQEKLYDEMTDVLTRERSQKYLEGYAGYIGKSKIQKKVEDLVLEEGRQLTVDDIPDWPWEEEYDGLPVYVNDAAGLFAFIDRGTAGRKRWPWTQGPGAEAYYSRQALTLAPEQYDRLHLNMWVSPTTAFLPIEWWLSCADNRLPESLPVWREPVTITECPAIDEYVDTPLGRVSKLAQYMSPDNWRVVGPATPVCLSADASVSGDCTALIGCTRNQSDGKYQDVVLQMAYKWDPPKGSKIDYDFTPNAVTGLSLKQQIIDTCMRYNVVQLSYDEWQLHHLTNEFRRDALTWCKPFSQSTQRDIADKQLYDIIKLKRLTYNPNNTMICHRDLAQHIQNAARQQRAKEDTKLHIVKASDDGKIDLVVALSMCTAETIRLDL